MAYRNMLRLLFLLATLLPGAVLAQTGPNWPLGYRPPPSEWQEWWTAKQDGASVSSNAALKALAPNSPSTVPGGWITAYRQGYNSAGDGGAAVYHWSSSSCSLNAGAGDNGSQVAPAAGGGCWVADFSGQRVTPMVFGAYGNGTTDDTTAVQAAITATVTAGIPLYVADGVHRYLISSALTSSGIVDLEGFAPVGNDGVSNAQNCVSGLVSNSDINLLTLTGPKVTVRDVCIQMTPSTSVSRASGAAILLGGSDQQSDIISGNTIFRPYDGISFGGAASNNLVRNSVARDNTIRDPARYGVAVGIGTSGGLTANITLVNNAVGCDSGYNTNGIGFAFFDGSVSYDGTNVGPNNCYIGTEIVPGSVSGVGQNANGEFKGVLGDSSGTHYTGGNTVYALYANPSTNLGTIEWLSFVDTWAAGAGGPASEVEMYIGNTNGGNCSNIKLTGVTVHSTTSQTGPLIDLEGCGNNVVSGSEIDGWPGGTVSGPGITVGANTRHFTITGNHIGNEGGATLSTGISVVAGAAYGVVSGNDLSLPTTPISYTPQSSTDRLVFGTNQGVDDLCPSLASAATITLTNVNSCYHLTGTTTVTSILNAFDSRRVTLITDSGLSFNTGGATAGICASNVTVGAAGAVQFLWNQTNQCWSHVP